MLLLLLDWSSNDWVSIGIGLWLDSRFQIFEFFDRSYCNLKAGFSGVVQVLSNRKKLRILADIGLAKVEDLGCCLLPVTRGWQCFPLLLL